MMTRRTALEAAFGIHKAGNSWSALIQSLLGVKHSVVIIHIKHSAEAAFLTLGGHTNGGQGVRAQGLCKSWRNQQRSRPFVLSYFNISFAYEVCLLTSFLYQPWPLSSFFCFPPLKREGSQAWKGKNSNHAFRPGGRALDHLILISTCL